MSYRRAAKVDANQPDIVEALRKMGFTVEDDHDDILVGTQGRTFWYEIKNPDRAASKKTGKALESRKQKSQKRIEATWRGHYKIVCSLDEILADIKVQLP